MNKTDYAPPSETTHFLVSGGGKGITAANTVALAEAFHSRFTLAGRSELLTSEPAWALNLDDENELKKAALASYQSAGKKPTPREVEREVNRVLSSREIEATLDKINKAGGRAEYVQVDITDPQDVKQKLASLSPQIDGILHGAGALADKYIEDKQEADFDLVYGVKVGGIKNLLDIIPPRQLDYLILFSSVAGFYGNAGQADYSLSNEILNKLAHHLKLVHPQCQILAIGWGPWDGGMVTPQLKRILVRKNVPLITLEAGTASLVSLLKVKQENPQRVIGNPLPFPGRKLPPEKKSYRISRNLSLEKNPFLADHVIGGNAVLPTVCAVAWFINSCESLYPGFIFYSIRDYQVFKGVVFEKNSPEDYLLEIDEEEKSADVLILGGKISSETPDHKTRYHYQARVEMRRQRPERPKINSFDLEPTNPILGDSLYKSRVLFHGPRFQGIHQVLNISSQGLTTECLLAEIPREEMGQFPVKDFNHFLADVHLQSLLIWADNQIGSIGLPLRIAEGTQYHPVPFNTKTYASMAVKTLTPHKLVADVIGHDSEGNIYTRVTDAEITLNGKLYELFRDNQLEGEPV